MIVELIDMNVKIYPLFLFFIVSGTFVILKSHSHEFFYNLIDTFSSQFCIEASWLRLIYKVLGDENLQYNGKL